MQPLNPGAGQAAPPDYSMVSGLEDIGYSGWHVKNITLPTCLGGDGTAVPVFAHSLLLIWPIIACVGAATSGAGFGEFTYYLLVTGPCTWAIVLLHEIGHLIAAQRCGGQPKKILLWPLGGLAISANVSTNPKDRIYISSMGPIAHIPLGVIFYLFSHIAYAAASDAAIKDCLAANQAAGSKCYISVETWSGWWYYFFWNLFLDNVLMFCFNALVPCFPLDCSSIVMNACLLRGMEKGKIARGLCYSSAVCIFVFVIIGIASIAGGFMSVNGSVNGWTWFLVAAWCTWQTWKLWSANQPGKNVEDHPLFKNAVAGDLGASTGPSNTICMAGFIGFICAVTTKFQEV